MIPSIVMLQIIQKVGCSSSSPKLNPAGLGVKQVRWGYTHAMKVTILDNNFSHKILQHYGIHTEADMMITRITVSHKL